MMHLISSRKLSFPFLKVFCPVVVGTVSLASAQSPQAPVVLDSSSGGCVATQEICGDGVDQNCDGSDLLCPGTDKDRDGYTSNDCDDTNRSVYPGISIACAASGGQGTQTCQSSGAFTACSTAPLCEAVGTGRCFYISALTGSDSNPGSFAAPWKTYRNIIDYSGGGSAPSTRVGLQPGDVVYFMSGLYRDTVPYSGMTYGMFLKNLNGTTSAPIKLKAYPGAHPVITPSSNAGGIYALSSSNLLIEGFEINRAYQYGTRFESVTNLEMRNMWIHDTDGVDNDNLAGVFFGNTSGTVHHSLIHDNYDRTCSDTSGNKTENSRNVVLFAGGNTRLSYNVIFQTPPITAQKTGGCITYKHSTAAPGPIFEVDHSVFWNCYHPVIGSGTYGTRIHHNLILDSDPIEIRDFGGTTHNEDIIVEKNTIIRTRGINYVPSSQWGPIGNFTYRNNIVVDNQSNNFENATVIIQPYGSDAEYTNLVVGGKLAFNNNCYHNPTAGVMWAVYARNGGGYGVLGNMYTTLSGILGIGLDSGSAIADPQLDGYHIPANAACAGKGWSAP